MGVKAEGVQTSAAASEKLAAEKTAGRSFNQAVAGLKDGVNAATTGAEKAQSSVKQGMEKVMRSAEDVMSFNQGAVEAVTKSVQIFTTGVQDLSAQAAQQAQARMEETMSAFRAMSGVKSVRDALDIQTNLGRSAVERMVAETNKLFEGWMKLAEQSSAPVTQHMTKAMERFTVSTTTAA